MLPSKVVNFLANDKYQMIIFNSNSELATDSLNKEITEIEALVKSYDKFFI